MVHWYERLETATPRQQAFFVLVLAEAVAEITQVSVCRQAVARLRTMFEKDSLNSDDTWEMGQGIQQLLDQPISGAKQLSHGFQRVLLARQVVRDATYAAAYAIEGVTEETMRLAREAVGASNQALGRVVWDRDLPNIALDQVLGPAPDATPALGTPTLIYMVEWQTGEGSMGSAHYLAQVSSSLSAAQAWLREHPETAPGGPGWWAVYPVAVDAKEGLSPSAIATYYDRSGLPLERRPRVPLEGIATST